MEFEKYIKRINIQEKIDNLAKKYKNKKVVLYGTDEFTQYLFKNYDFSKLNIIAITDKKYENIENEFFYNIPCIEPTKLIELDIDLFLVLNIKYTESINYIYDFLIKENSKTKVEWILKQNICDYIKNKIKYGKPKKKIGGKYIFTFWEPKEKMPAYIKLCIKTWKKFLPDYRIIILDYSNLDEWLGFEYFDDYLYKNFSLPMQADAIRIALLYKYDGIWLDADTIITTENIKSILNTNSNVVMINTHLAFIKAEKNSQLIKLWLKQIQRNIIKHKVYNLFSTFFKYLLTTKFIAKLDNWNFFGNSIIDPLSKKMNKNKFLSLDKKEYFALPENNFYKDEENKQYEKYIDFYFKNDFSDYVFKNTQGIILLHNSWTPPEYKKMSEKEFLKQDNTLAKVLLNLTENNNKEVRMDFKITSNDKILIIAPHPDDETIACGGFIAKYHNQIDVLCVNSSGIQNKGETKTAEEYAQIRINEFNNVMNLAEVNKTYIEKLWGKPVMIKEMEEHINDYMTQFNMKNYDIILVPHKFDDHPEHRYVGNILLRKMLEKQGYKENLKILRYELWSPLREVNYYEDITDFVEKKKELNLTYKTRGGKPYLERILALNKYRTLKTFFNNPEKYVEAFYVENLVEYLQIPDIINENTKISEKSMEFLEYLEKYNAQEKINKLAKKYKNKRIVLYGAGQFATVVFQNYDLSKLNIVGIADKRFEEDRTHEFFNLNCVKPDDLKTMNYDVILIANFDTRFFVNILDESILYGTKNAGVEIRPLLNLTFKDLF